MTTALVVFGTAAVFCLVVLPTTLALMRATSWALDESTPEPPAEPAPAQLPKHPSADLVAFAAKATARAVRAERRLSDAQIHAGVTSIAFNETEQRWEETMRDGSVFVKPVHCVDCRFLGNRMGLTYCDAFQPAAPPTRNALLNCPHYDPKRRG